MYIEKIIKDRGLVAFAERDGIEKALRCAFLEGQLYAVQQISQDLRASKQSRNACAERLERAVSGEED